MDYQQAPAQQTAIQVKKAKGSDEVDLQMQEALQILRVANKTYSEGKLDQALQEYSRVLEIKPDLADAQFRLAITLRDLRRRDEAKAAFHKVIEMQPRAALAWTNLGRMAMNEGDDAEAERCFRQAIENHFQLGIAHYDLAQLLLRQGRFEEGWKEYEWRWKTPQFRPFLCLQPRWDGQPIAGNLLLYTEQDVGDVLQFCRFIPEIRKRVQRLTLICADKLQCMFQAPNWADEVRSPGELANDSFAAHLPLMSAPYALKLHQEADFQAESGYLTPQPRSVTLPQPSIDGARLKVGLCWAAASSSQSAAARSMDPAVLGPLLAVPGVAFYSLQSGSADEQLAAIPGEHPNLQFLPDAQLDLADTAALLQQLDLVISVDGTVLHLAAGIGRPVWGLLSTICDWRWMQNREDSYWYPQLRLFRQQTQRNWDEVISRVAERLEAASQGNASLT